MSIRRSHPAPGTFDSLLRNAAYLAGSGLVVQLVGLLVGIITRRVLGPFLIGLTSTLELAQNYVSYANLGVIRAASRELPYSRGARDDFRARQIPEITLAVSFVSGVVSSGLVVALGVVLLADVGSPEALAAIVIYALAAIPDQAREHYLMMARSSERFTLIARVMVAATIVNAVIAIPGVYLWGIYGFLAAYAVQRTLRLAVLRLFQPESRFLRFHKAELKRLLIVGLPMAVGSFLYSINVTADELGVIWILGQQALGVYSIAIIGKAYLWQVGNSLASVWQPRLQFVYGQSHDAQALAQTILEQCRLLAFFAPVLFGIMFLAMQTLVGLFLPEFVGGVTAFQILLIAVSLRLVRALVGIYIETIKKQNVSLLLGAVAAPISLLAVVLLMRVGFGLQGAAVGATFGALFHYTLSGAYFSSKARQPLATFAHLMLLTLPIGYAYGVLVVLDTWVPWLPGEAVSSAVGNVGLRAGLYLLAVTPLVFLLYRMTPAWAMAKAAWMRRPCASAVDHYTGG